MAVELRPCDRHAQESLVRQPGVKPQPHHLLAEFEASAQAETTSYFTDSAEKSQNA